MPLRKMPGGASATPRTAYGGIWSSLNSKYTLEKGVLKKTGPACFCFSGDFLLVFLKGLSGVVGGFLSKS